MPWKSVVVKLRMHNFVSTTMLLLKHDFAKEDTKFEIKFPKVSPKSVSGAAPLGAAMLLHFLRFSRSLLQNTKTDPCFFCLKTCIRVKGTPRCTAGFLRNLPHNSPQHSWCFPGRQKSLTPKCHQVFPTRDFKFQIKFHYRRVHQDYTHS